MQVKYSIVMWQNDDVFLRIHNYEDNDDDDDDNDCADADIVAIEE